jgi:hypothetical protein
LRPLGCFLNVLLFILAIWLILLMSDSPLLDVFARLWFIVVNFAVSLGQSIWHFLGG